MILASRLLLSPVFVLCVAVAMADEPVTAASASQTVAAETLEAIDEAKTLFVDALQLSGKARLEGLRKSYEKLVVAVEADPVLPPARTIWAKMLLSVGDQKSARTTLQQSVSEHPSDPEAYVLLANEAVKQGQLAEAKLTYDAAAAHADAWSVDNLRRDPILAQIAAGLATVAQARSILAARSGNQELVARFDQEVLDQLRQWVAHAPESAGAHDRLAAALLKSGDQKGAVASFDRARQLNPKLPVTDLRLAQSQIVNGDEEAAIESVNRAVAEHSDDTGVMASAADLMMLMGRLDDAERQINAALNLDPTELSLLRLRAQLMRFRGQWKEAAQQLQSLNTQHPTDFETANLLALTLSELDEAERGRALSVATVTAQRFDAGSPQGLRARITLIWTAYAAGKVDAAKQALNQLLNTGIESNQISGDEGFLLSRLLVELGRPEIAAPLLESVLSRRGSFPKRVEAENLETQLN